MCPLNNIAQVNREILELIEKLRAGAVSLEDAESQIDAAEKIVEGYEPTRQSGKGYDGLPSRDALVFVMHVIKMARRELEEKKKSMGS